MGTLSGPQDNTDSPPRDGISDAARARTQHALHQRSGVKVQSLSSYIESRFAILRDNPDALPHQERDLLLEVQLLQIVAEKVSIGHFDYENAHQKLAQQFQNLQELYITCHAEGIIVTAASAMVFILRRFRPNIIIMDETSQLTEHAAAAVLSRFFGRLEKVDLIGDTNQTSAFNNSEAELVNTTKRDIMTRMKETGVPVTTLRVQYRMHPQIAHCVSHLFYDDQLIDDPSVINRPADAVWTAFVQRNIPTCVGNHSIFISVPPGTIYVPTGGNSKINPAHLCMAREIIERLRRQGVQDTDIGLFTTYSAQLRLHLQMANPGGVAMSTIDGAQGKEYTYVILDLVTPGGRAYGLGFVADPKRMCVGISRAKSGMIILGNEHMDQVPFRRTGAQAWKYLIERHKRNGGLWRHNVANANIQAEVQRFGLTGNRFRSVRAFNH